MTRRPKGPEIENRLSAVARKKRVCHDRAVRVGVARRELLRGGLEISVLSILAKGPLHGYGICMILRDSEDGVLSTTPATFYPLLRRIESEGLAKGEWRKGTGRRKIRVYSLTRAGRAELAKRRSLWGKMTHAVSRIVRAQA